MTAVAKPIPVKLKHDAIVEAIFEIRFDTATIPEILFGRLADLPAWVGFEQRRLPAYEIPDPLRQVDPNLRYTPVLELQHERSHRAVKVGAHVLSYHQLAPYVGWTGYKPELMKAIDGLFAKADKLTVRRLGLRYLNALTADLHNIQSFSDLDLRIAVEGRPITANVNLNFITELSENDSCTVRIATRELAQGALPERTTVIVDVDVFTKEPLRMKSEIGVVKHWLESAHDREKEHFFGLLTIDTIKMLREQ